LHAPWLDVKSGRIVVSPGKTDNAESLTTLPTRVGIVDIVKFVEDSGGAGQLAQVTVWRGPDGGALPPEMPRLLLQTRNETLPREAEQFGTL